MVLCTRRPKISISTSCAEIYAVELNWLILTKQRGQAFQSTFPADENISRNYQQREIQSNEFSVTYEISSSQKKFCKLFSTERKFYAFGYFGNSFYLFEVLIEIPLKLANQTQPYQWQFNIKM